jgi:hypothetical protein
MSSRRRPGRGLSLQRSRRAFLAHGLGLGAGLAPLLGALLWAGPLGAEPAALRGAQPAPRARARRFVGIYAPHGRALEYWVPGPGFDLRYENCSLQPFDDAPSFGRSFREQIVVIEGLDLSAGIEGGTVGHEGARALLTGSAADGSNASLDQFLAVERGLGSVTPHSSLVLGVGNDDTDIGSNISYLAGGRPVPKRIDPSEVYDRVFGELILPADARAAARVRAQREQQRSSLDFLNEQIEALERRLPPAEAARLDQHLTAQRELERRLQKFEVACRLPEQPQRFPRVRAGSGAARYFDAITNLQIDLLAQALACDVTRFGTLFLNDLSRTRLIEGMPEDIHFEVSHRYRARDAHQPGRPETWLPLARQNRYAHSKVARLLQRLDELGLLADTLVYASSDMGDPARHSSSSLPTVLAGGVFAGGRHIALSGDKSSAAVAHNHLLVSICQAFGVETERFGQARNPAIVSGALSEL